MRKIMKKVAVTSAAGKTAFVAKGKKIRLQTSVQLSPASKANKKVSYKSSNKKVASVNGNGEGIVQTNILQMIPSIVIQKQELILHV